MKFRVARGAGALACLAGILAGCTSTVSGTATPAPTSEPARSEDVFAGLNACQVLDDLYAGEGFEPGENKSRRNECGVLKPGFGSYGLALDPAQGLAEFAATNEGVVDTTVNGRPAMLANFFGGGCAVAMEVTEHARALVTVNMSRARDDAQACPNAQSLAERVEPLLPKTR